MHKYKHNQTIMVKWIIHVNHKSLYDFLFRVAVVFFLFCAQRVQVRRQ